MRTRFSTTLLAPRAELFRYLADPRNRPKWQSSILSLTMTSEGEPHVGMTWREHARGFGQFEMEITECEEGRVWAERGRSERGEIEVRLTFQDGAEAGTTELELDLTLRLAGVWSALAWLAPPVMRPLMRQDLRRAAALAAAPP